MDIIKKLKESLGLCSVDGCFRKAIVDLEIKQINHKGCLCDKHFDRVMNVIHDAEIEKQLIKGNCKKAQCIRCIRQKQIICKNNDKFTMRVCENFIPRTEFNSILDEI